MTKRINYSVQFQIWQQIASRLIRKADAHFAFQAAKTMLSGTAPVKNMKTNGNMF